jgi:hypothetical protein
VLERTSAALDAVEREYVKRLGPAVLPAKDRPYR